MLLCASTLAYQAAGSKRGGIHNDCHSLASSRLVSRVRGAHTLPRWEDDYREAGGARSGHFRAVRRLSGASAYGRRYRRGVWCCPGSIICSPWSASASGGTELGALAIWLLPIAFPLIMVSSARSASSGYHCLKRVDDRSLRGFPGDARRLCAPAADRGDVCGGRRLCRSAWPGSRRRVADALTFTVGFVLATGFRTRGHRDRGFWLPRRPASWR